MMALASRERLHPEQRPLETDQGGPGGGTAGDRRLSQIVKALVLVFEPLMPESMQRAWTMLGYEDRIADHPIAEATVPIGARPLPKPAPLFTKIEKEQVAALEATLNAQVEKAKAAAEPKMPTVSIDEFGNLDIRIAKVVSAEPIKGSKKLYKLVVDLGSEKRQVVSGIAQFYAPDELVGRDVALIANLAPAKIFGVESRGMILAAGDEASFVPFARSKPGTKVRHRTTGRPVFLEQLVVDDDPPVAAG